MHTFVYHVTKAVQAMEGSIMVVGVLTYCALLNSLCDLKAAQINMLYEFELGHDTVEVIRNASSVKGQVTVDHKTVIRWFKKFCSCCKNLDDQAMSVRPKAMDSEAVLKAIEANLASSAWRVSGEFSISQSSVLHHLHILCKTWLALVFVIQITKVFSSTVEHSDIIIQHQIHLDWAIGLVVECLPMARETGVLSQIESYQRLKKWYLIPPYWTLSIIRYISRVKWSNPGKGVAPSLTPWYSSYWKGSFPVALNYCCQQLYF